MNVWSCQHESCPEIIFINGKWDAIRAHSKGWYQSKDETVIYCPDHLPEWVLRFRAKAKK